jgi:hypothetical protein
VNLWGFREATAKSLDPRLRGDDDLAKPCAVRTGIARARSLDPRLREDDDLAKPCAVRTGQIVT